MKRSAGGQVLLMAVGILLTLLIAVPFIVLFNNIGTSHQAHSQKRTEATAVAEEGIAYAAAKMSNDWPNALAGNWGVVCPFCNAPGNVPGTQFNLTCKVGPLPYGVTVISSATIRGTYNTEATKWIQTFLSPKTIGASLGNGGRVAAALEVLKNPVYPAPLPDALTVHWGPIVNYSNAPTWTLVDPLDTNTVGASTFQGYPRKFSLHGITGSGAFPVYPRNANVSASAITTDNREYWAYASMEFPATINRSAYQAIARTYNNMPAPTANGSQAGCTLPVPPTGPCGDYVLSGFTPLLFDGSLGAAFPATAFVPAGTPKVIYIEGSATFQNLSVVVGDDLAIIVNGDLTLGPAAAGVASVLNVPLTAPQEYPYWPTGAITEWPGAAQCMNSPPPPAGILWKDAPQICNNPAPTSTQNVNLQAFLWVRGNLTVTGKWVIAGSVLVGDFATPSIPNGQLTVAPGGSLTIYYDDKTTHNIILNPR